MAGPVPPVDCLVLGEPPHRAAHGCTRWRARCAGFARIGMEYGRRYGAT